MGVSSLPAVVRLSVVLADVNRGRLLFFSDFIPLLLDLKFLRMRHLLGFEISSAGTLMFVTMGRWLSGDVDVG